MRFALESCLETFRDSVYAVHLSICLSVTLVTVQDIEMHFAPYDIGMFLVF